MVSQRIMRDRRGKSEVISNPESLNPFSDRWVTPGGIPVFFCAEPLVAGARPPFLVTCGFIRNTRD